MKPSTIIKTLVTLGGECFDAEFQDKHVLPLPPDDALYYFYLTDKVKKRGMHKVSVRRSGPEQYYSSILTPDWTLFW